MPGIIELISALTGDDGLIKAFKDDLIPELTKMLPLIIEILPALILFAKIMVGLAMVVAAFATGDWWVIILTTLGAIIGLAAGLKLAFATGPVGMGTAFLMSGIGALTGAAIGLGISNSGEDNPSDLDASIPQLASGGIVRSPTVALVGEAGASRTSATYVITDPALSKAFYRVRKLE